MALGRSGGRKFMQYLCTQEQPVQIVQHSLNAAPVHQIGVRDWLARSYFIPGGRERRRGGWSAHVPSHVVKPGKGSGLDGLL